MSLDVSLREVLLGFLAVSVRMTGLMLFAPFFGSMAIAPRMKAGLVVAMSVLLYPVVAPTLPVHPLDEWPQMVLMELLIGAGMGIASNLVFDAVQMAGQVLSVQMGFSLVNIIDPQTQVESTVMATLHQTVAMLIFLRLDVHLWLLEAMGRSFKVLPAGAGHVSAMFTLAAVRAAGMVFTLGLQMAAPAFSATLIADVVLALLGKASPHAPLMLLGSPVKMLLGFGVLYAALRYWPSLLERFFVLSMHLSERLLLLAR